MYSAHIISLILYLCIPVIAAISAKKAYDTFDGNVRFLTFTYLITSTAFSLLFIGLQLDWILSNNNDVVGDTTAFMWLVFDYVNAIGYIISNTLVGVVSDLFKVTYGRLKKLEEIPKCSFIGKHGIVCYDVDDLKKTNFKVDEIQKGINIYVKEVEELTDSLERISKAIK